MTLRTALSLTILLTVTACDRSPSPGFEGTWDNRNPNFGSSLYFRPRADGGYDIRYDVEREEARLRVLCPWEGPCQEYVDGELVGLWELESWLDPDSGLPRLKSTRRPLDADAEKATLWRTDEFELAEDGLTIVAWTCASQDVVYPAGQRPKRFFVKVSDRVREPVVP